MLHRVRTTRVLLVALLLVGCGKSTSKPAPGDEVHWALASQGLPENSWTLVADPVVGAALWAYRSHPPESSTGGERGTTELYRTDDAGATWRMISADIPVALSLLADPFRPGTLWGNSFVTVTFPATVYRSTDGGTTWNVVAAPEGGRLVAIAPDDGTIFLAVDGGSPPGDFANRIEGELFRSRDGGRTWEPLPALPRSIGVPCAATPGTRLLYVAECGDHFGPLVLAVSTDDGDTFAESAPPTILPDFFARSSTRLLVHASAPRTLHLAELLVGQTSSSFTGSKGGLYVSEDAAGTWSNLQTFTSGRGLHFVTDPRSATVLYGFGNRRVSDPPSLVNVLERSDDGGRSWSSVHGDLPDIPIGLVVGADGVPWVSSGGAVYRGSPP